MIDLLSVQWLKISLIWVNVHFISIKKTEFSGEVKRCEKIFRKPVPCHDTVRKL